ncbi:Carbon starvation protein A [uncultured Desulfobacterium sp.]|uniref:Carbon starvation protein A n=1 Tax=uncultured Desulfobacterium sp. TaxID=201089 RepID=A0A445MR91_9BACT|nr:Carbon starvation protein A [uncultured Desulfobacterium sp.]
MTIKNSKLKIQDYLIWSIVSIVAAISIAVVTGIVHPVEKVNALWIVTAAACFYAISYRFYAAFIAAKALSLDENRLTPAIRLNDGIDYDPTNKWVLFGHHFAAIAGAGPLIGPMLAAQFGYLPGFLWILIGAALAGGVHDMVILAASVRRDGKSLAQIAKEEIGPVGGFAASLAIIFIIVVALAGLGLAVVNALKNSPWGAYTIGLTIPIAFLMGFYLRFFRPGRVGEVSLIGVILLLIAVATGHYIPGSFLAPVFNLSEKAVVIVLAAYGFIASVLPVWMLLCPRDYLSTYMKIGTILLLAIGVIAMHPLLQMPPITQFADGGGPIIPGKIFPFMFITIACGAISGFHSLIASGTTPKMIMSENQIPAIGYGAMLTEGFVSMMALIAATILIPGDYFAINSKLSLEAISALGFPAQKIMELSEMVGVNVQGRPGGAVSLAVGMSSILSHIPGMKGLMPYWYNFALMFEALFILTTVDAGTRVARFLIQEMGGYVIKPLGRKNWIPGMIITSLLVVFAWAYLIYSGSVSSIWPMFGVSNQLLAAIALGVGTTVIIKAGKIRYAWTTFIPMVFMFFTTLFAAWRLMNIFRNNAIKALSNVERFNCNLDAVLVALMAVLAIISLVDMLHKWYGFISKNSDAKRWAINY